MVALPNLQSVFRSILFRYLSGVRLDFRLNPASGIAFLRMVKAHADINPSMDYRGALSDLIATVLPPALEKDRLPSGANDDWDGVVKALIDRFQSWSTKAKNISYVSRICPFSSLSTAK